MKHANGRGPFTGVSHTVGSQVIYVSFTDDQPFAGVLTVNGDEILWSNETVWTRGEKKA